MRRGQYIFLSYCVRLVMIYARYIYHQIFARLNAINYTFTKKKRKFKTVLFYNFYIPRTL